MLYNLLNHSHIVDISIASNFSLFLTTLQLTFLCKNLLPYFLILTRDRFTYVGLQSQRIQIFCNWYYEPSNVVFLFCVTCGLFQPNVPVFQGLTEFWFCPWICELPPLPPRHFHLPLKQAHNLSLQAQVMQWAWFCSLLVTCINVQDHIQSTPDNEGASASDL